MCWICSNKPIYGLFSSSQECCYSSYGSLLFATLGSGYVFLNSPLTHPREALVTDLNPYTQCCVKARMCEEFFIHRPSDNCNNYIPVSPGKAYLKPGTMFMYLYTGYMIN